MSANAEPDQAVDALSAQTSAPDTGEAHLDQLGNA